MLKCNTIKSKSYFFLREIFFTQAMLRPCHPSLSSQNTASKIDHSLPDDGLWRGGNSSHIKSVTRVGPEWELLPNSTKADRNLKCKVSSGETLPDSQSPEIIFQSTGTQSHPQKMLREGHTSPSDCQKGMQDNPQIPPAEVSSPALAPSAGKQIDHISEKIDLEGEELQTLLPRLLDVFDLDTTGEVHFGFCHLRCCVVIVVYLFVCLFETGSQDIALTGLVDLSM